MTTPGDPPSFDGTVVVYLQGSGRGDRWWSGLGRALVRRVEAELAAAGARLLIVETSGLPEFDGTRRFYERCGSVREARIQDFYRDGDHTVVFRKALHPEGGGGR